MRRISRPWLVTALIPLAGGFCAHSPLDQGAQAGISQPGHLNRGEAQAPDLHEKEELLQPSHQHVDRVDELVCHESLP